MQNFKDKESVLKLGYYQKSSILIFGFLIVIVVVIRVRNGIFDVLGENNCYARFLYIEKILYKKGGKIKIGIRLMKMIQYYQSYVKENFKEYNLGRKNDFIWIDM